MMAKMVGFLGSGLTSRIDGAADIRVTPSAFFPQIHPSRRRSRLKFTPSPSGSERRYLVWMIWPFIRIVLLTTPVFVGFGRLIDLARSEPVVVEKHGRPGVVVMAVEEFERLKVLESEHRAQTPKTGEAH